MEIKVKIFNTGPEPSGMRIPKDVLEEALKKPVTSEWVHLGQSDRMGENLSTIVGKLQKVEVDSDGAFATVETLQTPGGQILEKVMKVNPDSIGIVPMGYFTPDENGDIKDVDITGFSIEPRPVA